MNDRSTWPGLKTSFETDRASDATRGNSERARIRRTAGQMNSHLAAPSDRHAPRALVARSAAARRGAGPARPGSGGCSSNGLLLDAKTRDVCGELLVLAGRVGDPVPAIGDGLLRAVLVQLLGKILGDRGVEHVLFVLLGLRDPQVEHEVLVVEARLDRPEVVVGSRLAETGREPWGGVREVGGSIGVEAGLAERQVDARLSRRAHAR